MDSCFLPNKVSILMLHFSSKAYNSLEVDWSKDSKLNLSDFVTKFEGLKLCDSIVSLKPINVNKSYSQTFIGAIRESVFEF